MSITIEELATFCKRKGFVYQTAEIYGSLAGFWDYGPLGVELKNNIKQSWWKTFVQQKPYIAGIDGSIITHPKVWEASGHVSCFNDSTVKCTKCKTDFRTDHLIEDTLKQPMDGVPTQELATLLKKHNIVCPKCKGALCEPSQTNLMFSTTIGPMGGMTSYLRPETAQHMFVNFRLVQENARLKLPFGIAQVGRAFRNEISPRDFLFRAREFEQMEIEFFTHPDKADECPYFEAIKENEVNLLTDTQKTHKKVKLTELATHTTKWHTFWLSEAYRWFLELGINPENLRIRQHNKGELAHYAKACFDIEYHFPFGWKEIHGCADRGQFDLSQHTTTSKKDLAIFHEETKERVLPRVAAEPSQGVDRAFLAFMFDAYTYDKERENVVLRLHPRLAPVKVGVFPLVSNKEEVVKKAREIFNILNQEMLCQMDTSGSIGRRYARADEQGTFLCATIDFQTLEDDTVTLRDRDTTKQIRLNVRELKTTVEKLCKGELLTSFGTPFEPAAGQTKE